MKKILEDRRGQVGETMTWVVATIIIVVSLIAFIWITYAFLKAKSAVSFSKGVSFGGKVVFIDCIHDKTNFAFELNGNGKSAIEDWIDGKKG